VLTALGLLGVVALIAANGYFVAVEFSFVTARRSRFAEQAQAGDRRSARALAVHERLPFMLSGAQLGITVTSLVLGAVVEPAIATVLAPSLEAIGLPESTSLVVALLLALLVATVAQMVFGELAPKNLAIARPEPVARRLAPSAWWFMRLAGPLIWLFDAAATRLLRLLRVRPVDHLRGVMAPEELDLIVDSSAESGHLSPHQAQLLERAIGFSDLEASDAMIPWTRVVTINVGSSAADLRDLMSIHSRFPVVDDDDHVLGVVHAKDLLGVPPEEYGTTRVSSLSREILAVPEAAELIDVLAALRAQATELAVVIDEYGGPAGVVTLEDLVEELVGDIEDEYDPAAPGEHVEIEPGVWSVAATSRLDEIERVTGFELPEGEYDTVAGLVLERLEHIPAVGESVVVHGVVLEVLAVDGYTIERLRLEAAAEAATGEGDSAEVDP
jgi:CBS domain containing-hemolysin-like protein